MSVSKNDVKVKLKVSVSYVIEVTEDGLRNYEDTSPAAIAAVEKQSIDEDPAVIGADLFDIPYEVSVTPMEITS